MNGKAGIRMRTMKERAMKCVFLLAACASVLAVALICVFLFDSGLEAIREIGLWNFISGKKWKPKLDVYGIYPMILGSLYVTAGAIIAGVPLGVLTAVYLARYCPRRLYRVLKPATELLAGIPSVVYGFFGLTALLPIVGKLTDTNGYSILTASLLLGIMILPTIIGVSESAVRNVPSSYYEGGRALGASHERSVYRIVLPAAKSGVLAGVVLGIGRAVGETMAIIMVAGNQARMPKGLLKGARTLTVNIVMEMGLSTVSEDAGRRVSFGQL